MNEEAKALRIKWMTEMGLGEDEIEEYLILEPPVSVEEEQAELPKNRSENLSGYAWRFFNGE